VYGALLGLAAPVLAQDCDGVPVEGDGVDAGGGLWFAFDVSISCFRRRASIAHRSPTFVSQAPGLSVRVRRPLFESGEQRVLRQLLGPSHIPHHPGQAGDDLRGFDPPHRLDRVMYLGSPHER
jgi:hypothetical protein